MIDIAGRARLRQQSSSKAMVDGVKEALKIGLESKGAEDTLKMVFEKNEDAEVKDLLRKIGQALPIIHKAIPRSFTLPKIFNIKGSVKVENPISVNNLSGVEKRLENVETSIRMLATAISSIPQQKIEFPKLDIPKQEKIDFSPIVEAVQKLETPSKEDSIPVLRDIKKTMQALVDKPTFTPQPVTSVSIRPLQGSIKTTSATVGSTLTKLPTYGQLFSRRSVMVYNNSANTIYIGGSDVTSSNGMPVPANSYSPILDCGYNMILYGIAATGSNDVRVIEIADTNVNGVNYQE